MVVSAHNMYTRIVEIRGTSSLMSLQRRYAAGNVCLETSRRQCQALFSGVTMLPIGYGYMPQNLAIEWLFPSTRAERYASATT